MSAPLRADVLKPGELGAAEQALWRAFRDASPAHDSPYFDLRYILAAGEVAPHARVAVLHRAGRPSGFFPFQMRGSLVQPLAAPMTDYHGVIAAPGERIDPGQALALVGEGRSFRFGGLVSDAPLAGGVVHQTMTADLAGGFEAWLERQRALHPRFFKGKQRARRAIERDLGPLRLVWSRRSEGLLEYVLGLKRAQYLRTRKHDVFACGWTERLLRTLDERAEADFGLTYASLYAGDMLVGAEVGLRSGPVQHLWFPVYEPEHARYGPGMLMTIESLRAAAAHGVARVDFGRNDCEYKRYFAEPAGTVVEGRIRAGAGGREVAAVGDRLLAAAPPRLARLGEKVRRRFDVIAACETTAWGWCAAAALALCVFAGAASPVVSQTQPRRPHMQRAGSVVVARTDGLKDLGRISG